MEELDIIENSHTARLQDRGFHVYRGFNDQVAALLYDGTRDPVVIAHTHDAERFKTPESVMQWHESSSTPRTFYSLGNAALSAVIWFGESKSVHSSATATFAIRMYDGARGLGIAGDFLEAAHEDFATIHGGDVWLAVKNTNSAAQRLYKNHGYIQDDETDGSITMTRELSRK